MSKHSNRGGSESVGQYMWPRIFAIMFTGCLKSKKAPSIAYVVGQIFVSGLWQCYLVTEPTFTRS